MSFIYLNLPETILNPAFRMSARDECFKLLIHLFEEALNFAYFF